MNTEQEYIDSIVSIQNEIKFWENNYENFKRRRFDNHYKNSCIEKIQFFTEQKEKLKKEFKEFLQKDLEVSN